MILIVSTSDDLHALEVQRRLASYKSGVCSIIAVDRVGGEEVFSYRCPPNSKGNTFRNLDGDLINISDVGLLWLRRPNSEQSEIKAANPLAAEVINNECRGALAGLLRCYFEGKWISDPEATHRASDKLYQLSAARKAGFRIPKTIVTQRREEVRDFWHENRGKIIVKSIVGADNQILLTRRVDDPDHFSADAFRSAPSMYQEFIDGVRHIRLHLFGQSAYAAQIITDAVDWRPDLTTSISEWPVPEKVRATARLALDYLGLEMGIIDLKEDSDGIWSGSRSIHKGSSYTWTRCLI